MSEMPKHSKLGIASCLIALGIWGCLALIFALILNFESFSKFLGDSFFKLLNIETGLAVIVVVFLFGVIPIGGHLLGIIFGIAGSCAKNKQRVFAVIGLILNILPFFIIPILFVFS
jgi:hypothetical protein